MSDCEGKSTMSDAKAGRPEMVQPRRLLISGASGLIGTHLVPSLRASGHEVVALTRGSAGSSGRASPSASIQWQPDQGVLDANDVSGFDGVVHLAAENLGARRWSRSQKERILKSRVESTALLSKALAGQAKKPSVLVCASAVGVYGNRGEEILDEESSSGEGFAARVCREWEAASEPAVAAGIRVVHLRIGMVLAAGGGVLPRFLTPFLLGLGGPIGSGAQYMSWIAMDDLLRVIHLTLENSNIKGVVNATSPDPVTNRTFVKILGRVLRRPAIFPLPSWVVRGLFGEMGQALLLEGQRVLPGKLVESGFIFNYPTLETALRHYILFRETKVNS